MPMFRSSKRAQALREAEDAIARQQKLKLEKEQHQQEIAAETKRVNDHIKRRLS